MDERYWVRPPDYDRFFPGEVPEDADGRRLYAREILGRFAERAFRRPVDDATKDRLAALAEAVSAREGQTFEAGVAQAMAAVLTSPRFLFREEAAEPGSTGRYPLVDEYALASRLSYFLWSSMPDDELFRLAGEHKLRANLRAQVDRMLADPRSAEFIRNFVGQWLQARDIETVLINAPAVISRDEVPDPEAEQRRERFRELIRKPPEELTDAEKKELQEARSVVLRLVPPLPRIRADRRPAAGHAERDRDALRAHRPGGPEPPGAARQRLHVPQRAAGEALRDRGRPGRSDAPGRRCPRGARAAAS